MEDSEPEEGEACDFPLDPDAYSYIDEKIQNVLGHFQKEFVGGEISAENLGAKWGGYGSFLPSYKRSPSVLTQPNPNPRSSAEAKVPNRQVVPNPNISKNTLPSRAPPAGNNNNININKREMNLHASGPSSRPAPIPKTNTSAAITTNINNSNTNINTNVNNNNSMNNSNNSNNSSKSKADQKTLKVRIKVGSDNNSRRSNNNTITTNINTNNSNMNNNAVLYNNLGLDISPSSSYDASTGGSTGPSPVSKVPPGESPQSILQRMTCIMTPGGFMLSPLRGCFINFTGKITTTKNTPLITGQNHTDMDLIVRESKGPKIKSARPDKKRQINTGKSKNFKAEFTNLPSKESHFDEEIHFKGEKSTNELVNQEKTEPFQNAEIGDSNLKGKGKLKQIKGERKFEEESLRDSKSKGESKKKSSLSKTDSEESNKKNGVNINTSVKKNLLEGGENLGAPKKSQFEDKRVKKEKHKSNNTPSIDSKERRKDSVPRPKMSENIPKTEEEKEKEIYNQLFDDPIRDDNNHNNKDLSESKKKPIGIKSENERDFPPAPKERSSINRFEKEPINERPNINRLEKEPINERPSFNRFEKEPINNSENFVNNSSQVPIPVNNNPVPSFVPPLVPMEIKEHWVGCDKCEKWRLLPYWTNPDSLPKKWHCKLLDWLPGKNRCDVSEEETTAGANALNLVPIPNTAQNVAVPVAGQTGHTNPAMNQNIPKKDNSNNNKGTDVGGYSASQVKRKEKGKVGGVKEMASFSDTKSAEFGAEGKKLVKQSSGRFSDGGDIMEKTAKHSKSKNKRPVDLEDSKAVKKLKREENPIPYPKEKPIPKPEKFDQPRVSKFDKKETSENETERYDKSDEKIGTIQEKKPRVSRFDKKETFNYETERFDKPEEKIGGSQEKKVKDRPKFAMKGPSSNKLEEPGISAKKEGNFVHPSAEATSSSSKISGSRRSRSKTKQIPEKRGSSPVESVSSSPVRGSISNSERIQRKMKGVKDEEVNIASYTLPFVSPKRNASTEIERPSKQTRLSETHRAGPGSTKNVPLDQDNNRFNVGSSGNSNKDGRKLGKSEMRSSSRPPKEKERIPTNPDKAGEKKQPTPLPHLSSTATPAFKTEAKTRVPNNSDASRSVQPPPQHPKIPQPTRLNPVEATASPARRPDSHSAAYVLLKEARVLKHTADRMKNEESELEGIGLYFEAALKFLQAASLCEPVGNDNSRQGDSTQAMQIYSDTAKLCEFCAHAYERCKRMGAAALAYKCVEVAYLKAAFYKHPSASRDRHEIQTTLQTVQTGESPSSSASDIDNLNKAVKDSNSPAAGNHLFATRNHAHMMRLLAYTNDLNCAFEATKKSQTAFTSALSSNEIAEGSITSVRRALDFGFHNVRDLIQLIRVSMDSVSS